MVENVLLNLDDKLSLESVVEILEGTSRSYISDYKIEI